MTDNTINTIMAKLEEMDDRLKRMESVEERRQWWAERVGTAVITAGMMVILGVAAWLSKFVWNHQ